MKNENLMFHVGQIVYLKWEVCFNHPKYKRSEVTVTSITSVFAKTEFGSIRLNGGQFPHDNDKSFKYVEGDQSHCARVFMTKQHIHLIDKIETQVIQLQSLICTITEKESEATVSKCLSELIQFNDWLNAKATREQEE